MYRHLFLVFTLSALGACGSEGGNSTSSATSATSDTQGDAATVADGQQAGPATPVTPPDLAGLTGPCTVSSECVFACTVDYCGGCECEGVGVLASQQDELESRKAELAAQCQAGPQCAVWPPPPSVACVYGLDDTGQGSCSVKLQASTEDLLACTEDTDCTVSTTKFVCSRCPCGGTAVAKDHLEAWLQRVEDMSFYCPSPAEDEDGECGDSGMCDQGPPVCEDGLCAVYLVGDQGR
jgi:hypothetical protein